MLGMYIQGTYHAVSLKLICGWERYLIEASPVEIDLEMRFFFLIEGGKILLGKLHEKKWVFYCESSPTQLLKDQTFEVTERCLPSCAKQALFSWATTG